MSAELIPALLLTLLLLSVDAPGATVAQLVLSGDHTLERPPGAVIVGDAAVTVPAGTEVGAPLYLIGGTTRVDGDVRARVTQVAGELVVGDNARIDALRQIGGRRTVADGAQIAARTDVTVTPADGGVLASVLPVLLSATVLALLAARLTRTRRRNVDIAAEAVARHPVVTFTVGALTFLTGVALLVFMAFTLVLIPVAIIGLLVGAGSIALGVVAWGHRIGALLPVGGATASGLGVAVAVVGLRLVGLLPVIGDLIVAFVALSGLGAVLVTYLGFQRFRPAPLPG